MILEQFCLQDLRSCSPNRPASSVKCIYLQTEHRRVPSPCAVADRWPVPASSGSRAPLRRCRLLLPTLSSAAARHFANAVASAPWGFAVGTM